MSIDRLNAEQGLRRSQRAELLLRFDAVPMTRPRLLSLATRLEGGAFYSYSLRKRLLSRHGVYAGAYSYGEWTRPGAFPSGVVIGRYASIAANVKILLRNHPYDRLSMHPFFYNRVLGYVEEDNIHGSKCWIGHDAWLGESAIITPGCSRIGIGAVVGAGAIVTKDVPDFAIVGGNPAKLLKYRFGESERGRILESQWWERSIDTLIPYLADLVTPFGKIPLNHPLFNAVTSISIGTIGNSK